MTMKVTSWFPTLGGIRREAELGAHQPGAGRKAERREDECVAVLVRRREREGELCPDLHVLVADRRQHRRMVHPGPRP